MPISDKEKLARKEAFYAGVAKKTVSSPLFTTLSGNGAEFEVRPIRHRAQAFWNASKDHLLGSDEEVLTDLGKLRKRNPQPWRAAKALAKKAVDRAPTAMSAHMNESFEKMDDRRGILDVEGFADKLTAYIPGNESTMESSAKELIYNALVETFNDYGREMSMIHPVRFSDIDIWIQQLNPNKNSGNPDYTPVSKTQAVEEYWPVMRDTLKRIVNDGDMTATQPPYSDNVYAGFHRSPNRPIHGAGIFDKLIGAFFNYHIVQGLAGGTSIAWENLEDMFSTISEELSTAESTMHDDFKSYDGHFSLEMNLLITDAFLESNFLKGQKELRNAFEWFCRRLTDPEVYLQISPTHVMKMRPALFSGTPVTQFWGCILHDAYYRVLRDVYGMGIIGYHILSDDGMAVMEDSFRTTEKNVETIVSDFAVAIGQEVNVPKSYVADLSVTTKMHDDVDIITHDMGPFLQFYPQMDSANTFGNVPRKFWSLHERERDSSEATRMTLLLQHAPSLARHKVGMDRKGLANWVSDLHRSLDVISTIRPRYPRIREVLIWFAKVYPNFWKKFQRLFTAADSDLWDERTLMAGGTRQGGTTAWVTGFYNEWQEAGTPPRRVA